ncbi:MAG TPA: cyanophycin synthetase [Blastocatellia bacterium]|nr:cyanophycin synthetase [Blastocatellia bacterium]
MRIGEIRALAGPNIYSHRPVLLMTLDLENLAGRESYEVPGFNERLLALLPGLNEHHCSKNRPGGFIERLQEGTWFGHIVEHVALELTKLAGIGAIHGKTRQTGEPGWFRIAIEYKAEQGTKYLLRTAVALVEALVRNKPFPLAERLKEAEAIIARTEPGPSTQSIIRAALRRGIPVRRIGTDSLVQLGYGTQRRFIQAAMTSQTSAVAVDIAADKDLTKRLLREAGIAVPEGCLAATEAEALAAPDEIGWPVAVKPGNGCQGKGVSLNLTTPVQVRHAFRLAQQYSAKVIVEQQFTGRDYRVLVVNGKMVAASERIPACVTGDGEHTIAQLIEIINQQPERGEDHEKALTRIRPDAVMTEFLRRQGLDLSYRPARGETVYLRECANLSTGGTARDVTEQVHPEIAAMCERAARVIGLDVCGLDLMLDDIARPAGPGNGILEVNAAPGLRMHLAPGEGASRDVGSAIVEMLYPGDSSGRIPIISITGTNGKTTITRMIGHVIAESGKTVGVTTTDGIYIGGRLIEKGDTTGPQSARTVLSDPSVEVAVLETARGGIMRGGLGYDWSDISIISNVRLDHLGQDGLESLDDLLFVKSLVAERVRAGGTLILNADDERLAQLMEIPRVSRVAKNVVYFSLHPLHVVIRRHLDGGGLALLYRDGWIVEAAGSSETRIIRAAEIPATLNGAAWFHVANALAAVAACRAYGLSREAIAGALRNFHCTGHNQGRAGLYEVAGGYVLVDYGHNPDAFAAICRMATAWEGRRLTGVIGVPGDRNNSVIEQSGRAAARGFHRLFIKEDADLRGRRSGEVAELLHRAVLSEAPGRECRIVMKETEALRAALDEITPGEIIVVFYEKLDPVLALLREYGAVPAADVPPLQVQTKAARQAAAGRAKTNRRLMQA